MTCIVGIETAEGVLIGGDSSGLSGWTRTHRADPKVYENGDYLIGFTTSFRMGQIIRYTDLPKPLDRDGEDLDRFIATEFIDGIRQALKDAGWAKKESDREDAGTFLLGVRGRLYQVCDDYQVACSLDGYEACGSGREMALGALHATRGLKAEPRIRRALDAAAHHSGSVHGPFTILWKPHA
jgi:ATP-dependent protease HslVU (ClpYQ) peptidase subunit